MREIRFRAWDTLKKEWADIGSHFGGFLYDLEGGYFYTLEGPDGEEWAETVPEGRLVLEQFTGLLDKNGKEIYEGDILSWQTEDGSEVEKSEIYWDESEACFDGAPNGWSCTNFYLVIGNIHESPELLK